MTTITPRQLFDAATKAGLAMPDAVTGEMNGESYVDFRACRSASLADVECAVMDALASKWHRVFLSGTNSTWYLELRDNPKKICDLKFVCTEHPTRAAALLAACEALAKEGK